MGKLIEVNPSNYESDILKAQGLVLMDFWAPWCGPCRMQSPILEKIAGDPQMNVTIAKVNTDENQSLAENMGISSIPTLILMKNGKEIDRFVGVQPEKALKEKLKQQM